MRAMHIKAPTFAAVVHSAHFAIYTQRMFKELALFAALLAISAAAYPQAYSNEMVCNVHERHRTNADLAGYLNTRDFLHLLEVSRD